MSRAGLGLAMLALVVVGCATPKRAEQAGGVEEEAAQTAGDVEPADESPEELPDAAADPWSKRPGTEDPEEEPPVVTQVRFQEPDPWPRPLAPARRPRLPLPAELALVQVRDGELVFEADAVLKLDSLLASDTELSQIVGLGAPARGEVTLAQLAAQARAEGRHLLLLEVRPGQDGRARDGYLLLAEDATLLAAYQVRAEARPPGATSEGGPPDLPERVGRAFARLHP